MDHASTTSRNPNRGRVAKVILPERHGAVLLLSAFLMVVLLGMVAFAVDVGYIANTRAELQRAVDSGALAGAGELVNGTAAVTPVVQQYIQANVVGSRQVQNSEITIQTGNFTNGAFVPTTQLPSALKVTANFQNQPLFFGKVLGKNTFNLTNTAIAQYQPRDIMVTLDFSGSMNDDSTLRAVPTFGKTAVENSLKQIHADLGSPVWGQLGTSLTSIASSKTAAQVKTQLGLTNLAYPYAQGSWSEYIDYVKGNLSTSTDLVSNGYSNKYGVVTFMDYLQTTRASYAETPVLWKTSEQPVTALKDAMTVFMSYLQSTQTDDHLGLTVYDSPNETAVLESHLTLDYNSVNTICRQRQAGHYKPNTNIGAGLQTSRLELQNNARVGAFKMIILMTDGIANQPTNTATAKAFVLSEANLCAKANIPVIAIGLGAGADTALLQQVADLTKGACFIVPGGQNAQQYKDQLTDIFGKVAANRPLKLVK